VRGAAAGHSHRYRLPDLLRLYAQEVFTAEGTPADREACLDRLVGWLTATAEPGRWPAEELDPAVESVGVCG
jgi:hypothetical protein